MFIVGVAMVVIGVPLFGARDHIGWVKGGYASTAASLLIAGVGLIVFAIVLWRNRKRDA